MPMENDKFKVSSDEIVGKVRELIKEGNIRRIIIKNEADQSLLEIPVTLALVGTVLAPILAALGAAAALLTNCTIEVERKP